MRNKRQKHVFNSGEIPHLWAHRTQDDARNRQGNLYFNGDTIYSYGSHFPIARHIFNKAGDRAVLFTTASYSVTTSGHCSAVHSAIPSETRVFHVPEVYPDTSTVKEAHERNLKHYAETADEHVSKCARARSSFNKEWHHKQAEEIRKEALAYCRFFHLPKPTIKAIPALDSKLLEKIRHLEAQRAAEKAEQTKRERAEAIARQQELITKWRTGQYSGCLYDVPAMLRIDGDEVLTSRGVRFPVSHAKRALDFVRKIRASGEAYVRNGKTIHLGLYAIDRIEPDGTVKAGCHVVSWQEIERIAPLLDSISTSATAVDSTPEVLS
jgi:hypothetical protein